MIFFPLSFRTIINSIIAIIESTDISIPKNNLVLFRLHTIETIKPINKRNIIGHKIRVNSSNLKHLFSDISNI